MIDKLYSEAGLTAEQLAQVTMDVIEILGNQIDLNALLKELNERHTEFTDEQRKVLGFDDSFEENAFEVWFGRCFENKNEMLECILSMYNDDEPKLQSTNETEQEGEQAANQKG